MSADFTADIDARLARAACGAVVDGDGGVARRVRASLEDVAAALSSADRPGLADLSGILRRLAAAVTEADALGALAIAEQLWADWKRGAAGGPAAPSAGAPMPSGPGDPVAADVAALAADPVLASMFVEEALDHLSAIEATVLALEAAPADARLLDDLFRPFHTVKGNAGALGVQTVQGVAHVVESLLDRCRSGQHALGTAEVGVVLEAVDLLTTMLADLRTRLAGQAGVDTSAARTDLLARVCALIDGHVPAPPAPAGRDTTAPRAAAEHDSIKVDTRKLDHMVDMVGELVIAQSILLADPRLADARDETFGRHLAQLRRITDELQRNAMAMRMVPIRQTFQKMARLVRDLSKKSGKPVDLVLAGEETELDRKLVEAISDPLMHMIRNSIDHGIEPADVRRARGKRASGRLSLSATHQGGSILIELADDGAGLDTAKIRAKAVAQGLIADDAPLDDADIHLLIFRPGFSTADEVTEISGRGVGMDVVRRNIERLRGRVDIQSTPGQGATFSIKLPLTLAIVDALLLRAGRERYVLPAFAVRESLRPSTDAIHAVHGTPCMVRVRDALIPFAPLADLLGAEDGVRVASEGTIVVIEDDGRPAALLVDELVGKQEVVIKGLGHLFTDVRGIAGGAILGDGRIGLILDGGALVQMIRGSAARAA
ncbi:MAG: chemotaxis protein CheA [Acidobacteriota bacterium]